MENQPSQPVNIPKPPQQSQNDDRGRRRERAPTFLPTGRVDTGDEPDHDNKDEEHEEEEEEEKEKEKEEKEHKNENVNIANN